MKAIVLRGFGGPEVLRLEEVPTPTPAAGEILVKVRSVSVNRTLDLIVRQGNYPVKVQLPHILGVDPAGVVAHVGTDTDTRSRSAIASLCCHSSLVASAATA